MTIESELSDIVDEVALLTAAVTTQQTGVNDAVATFAATTERVEELPLVDNTADADKPISDAAQIAIDAKQDLLISGDNLSTVNGSSLLDGVSLVIERSATSLAARTYETRAALRLDPGVVLPSVVDDSIMVEGLGLFMFIDNRAEPDDDETCFTPVTVEDLGADPVIVAGQWLLTVPAPDLIDAMSSFESEYSRDLDEDEPSRFAAYTAAN
jgi:hypothetical protein